jgi:hypothetical protein
LDYEGFKTLFDTKVPPGCASLPEPYTGKIECLKFSPKKAKAALSKDHPPEKIEFFFSRLGGEGVQRGAEWFQGQWKKNLGVLISLRSEEQAVYIRHLHAKPPAIFRKGVGLDRPTCLAALELFEKDNPENLIQYDDKEFAEDLRELRAAHSSNDKQRACKKGVERLMHSFRLIPLGRWYFDVLARPTFVGWKLNELNQFDLTDLKKVQSP